MGPSPLVYVLHALKSSSAQLSLDWKHLEGREYACYFAIFLLSPADTHAQSPLLPSYTHTHIHTPSPHSIHRRLKCVLGFKIEISIQNLCFHEEGLEGRQERSWTRDSYSSQVGTYLVILLFSSSSDFCNTKSGDTRGSPLLEYALCPF